MLTGIDKNSQNNFDRDMYQRIKDKCYIIDVCESLIDLSVKIYGHFDYTYCRTMLYNSVLAPWYGTLPQLRFDVSTVIRDDWTRNYLDAFAYGESYLNAMLKRRDVDF